MARVTSASLTCPRGGCTRDAPCSRCSGIRTEAAVFAKYALGRQDVILGADITEAVNDAAAAEMMRHTELDSAIASNRLYAKEADAKQREIAQKDNFSADDAAHLKHLENLQDSYAVINEGLMTKAALADTEAHEALLSLVMGLLRAQFVPDSVADSAPAASEPVTAPAPEPPSSKKAMKAKAKADEDTAIAEAMERAAAEKREQEEAERAGEARRHARLQAEAQKAAQCARAEAAQRDDEVANAIAVANSLVADELKTKGPLKVDTISTARLFESNLVLAENQRRMALANGTELPTAPASNQAFVDLLVCSPLSSDRERCISFLSTGWASDLGCAPTPPLSAPPTVAGQQPWQAVKRSSGASSSKRSGAAPSGYAGKVPSARISRGTVGDQGGRLRPSDAGGPRDDAGNTPSAVFGMPRPKAGPSGRPGGTALRRATRPPSPAPTHGGGSPSFASASAARGGAGLANNDGRRGASGAVFKDLVRPLAPTPTPASDFDLLARVRALEDAAVRVSGGAAPATPSPTPSSARSPLRLRR